MPLLKFSSSNMLNSSLVDVSSGIHAYDIVTVQLPSEENEESSSLSSESSDAASSSRSKPLSSSSKCLPRTMSSLSAEMVHHTTITDATGQIAAEVRWNGRRPTITIRDEKVGALTDLFGTTITRFIPKNLCIPTRFDTEYIWTATPDSLTLYDYDTDSAKGTFYQNVVRVPCRRKPLTKKKSFLLSAYQRSTSPSSSSSSVSSISEESFSIRRDPKKQSFFHAHLPGVGSNYLDFESHPLADDAEIIVSFLIMEIMRCHRFQLPLFLFGKPRLWPLHEVQQLVMRRIRKQNI